MKEIYVPNYGKIIIKNIIFDVNGTLQFKGEISDDLILKFKLLKEKYNVYLISSDTRGNLKKLAEKLNVEYIRVSSKDINDSEAKNNELEKLGKNVTVAVGNGNNDALILKNAIIGIVIIGSEGASIKSILNADVAFSNPIHAIDFLLDDITMISTLRK
ncbi:MAG: HAD family hydrolase [Promethearchaeota archaeon]